MRALLVAVALVLCTIVVSPTLASATSVDLSCVGTETLTYQPGLLLTPQPVVVTVNAILAPCTSSDPSITSGTSLLNTTAVSSCATLFAGGAFTRVTNWSNGESSTFSFNRAVNNVGGQTTVTLTGTVIGGKFAGATAVQQVVFVTPNTLQCLAPPGLTTLGPGVAILTITAP